MCIEKLLREFAEENGMLSKGPLCVALVITRRAKEEGLPLNPERHLTARGGQVKGLGKGAVQKVLNDHGVNRVLAEEGGRTSRGSIENMRAYVAFLNDLNEKGLSDIEKIEKWWVTQVSEFFAREPFVLRFDTSKSLRAIVRDLLRQAETRQRASPGSTYIGTVLQHLVGAKLSLLVGDAVVHRSASAADEPSKQPGDFLIEDVAIHVTTTPSESLIKKCALNLDGALRPMVVTLLPHILSTESLAENAGLLDRIEVFDGEQFIAGNLYEIGKFTRIGRQTTAEELIKEYNRIIEISETDPSLKIKFG